MSYQEPFEEFQKKWLKNIADSIGVNEGHEIYNLRAQLVSAKAESERLRKLIRDYIQAHDNRDVGHKDDFSHESWNKYIKLFKDLRSIAS